MSFKTLPPQRQSLYTPFLASLDAGHALDRLEGDERLYLSLLDHLLQENEDAPRRIAKALATGDTKTAITLTHSLSGAAGNLGVIDVHHDAQRLMIALRKKVPCAAELSSLGQSLREARATIEVLKAHILPNLPAKTPKEPGTPTPFDRTEVLTLCHALGDRDFASVDLYARCRPYLSMHYPQMIPALDQEMDLLNFKNAASLLASYLESSL